MSSRKLEIVIPQDVAGKYEKYCKAIKRKTAEHLAAMIMESIPQLYNTEKLGPIIQKTRNLNVNSGSLKKFHVQLPDEVSQEIHIYCNFFRLNHFRSNFLYCLIEESILQQVS